MDDVNTINKIIIKNDKLLILTRKLRFNLYIKNILLSISVLTNLFLFYNCQKN